MAGQLIDHARGVNGFGYDPIFVPDGFSETSGEIAPDIKDSISHRGKAMRALAELISAEREKWA
jgi:XTP/dITP diphosphohydrolase